MLRLTIALEVQAIEKRGAHVEGSRNRGKQRLGFKKPPFLSFPLTELEGLCRAGQLRCDPLIDWAPNERRPANGIKVVLNESL